MDGLANGRMNGWMDEWMDGWKDEWMDGWMNGWMDQKVIQIDQWTINCKEMTLKITNSCNIYIPPLSLSL